MRPAPNTAHQTLGPPGWRVLLCTVCLLMLAASAVARDVVRTDYTYTFEAQEEGQALAGAASDGLFRAGGDGTTARKAVLDGQGVLLIESGSGNGRLVTAFSDPVPTWVTLHLDLKKVMLDDGDQLRILARGRGGPLTDLTVQRDRSTRDLVLTLDGARRLVVPADVVAAGAVTMSFHVDTREHAQQVSVASDGLKPETVRTEILRERTAGLIQFSMELSGADARVWIDNVRFERDPLDVRIPLVILKLDDFTPMKNGGVPASWERMVEVLERHDIKASFGVIGAKVQALARPEFYEWMKAPHASGRVDFWNHGWTHKQEKSEQGETVAEFRGPSLEEQASSLRRTQELVRRETGITLRALGTPFNYKDQNTLAAIEAIPDLRLWLLGPDDAESESVQVLVREVNLEKPLFVPNLQSVAQGYEVRNKERDYLVLQGHPGQWGAERWEQFEQVVAFLKERGCRFVTVGEYLDAAK